MPDRKLNFFPTGLPTYCGKENCNEEFVTFRRPQRAFAFLILKRWKFRKYFLVYFSLFFLRGKGDKEIVVGLSLIFTSSCSFGDHTSHWRKFISAQARNRYGDCMLSVPLWIWCERGLTHESTVGKPTLRQFCVTLNSSYCNRGALTDYV